MIRKTTIVGLALLGVMAITSTQAAHCRTLTNFNELSDYLTAGYKVRIIWNFNYCEPKNKKQMVSKAAVQMIGGASIDKFIYLTKARKIITSNAPLVQMPGGSYAYNYVRYSIGADGTVDVFTSMIDIKTKSITPIGDYICHYDAGKESGVRFRVCR